MKKEEIEAPKESLKKDDDQIIDDVEDIMNSEDIAPKKELFKSDLSTAVVTPLSSKIEIINTIVPKIPRVKKIKKEKEEALSKTIIKTGKFKGRR